MKINVGWRALCDHVLLRPQWTTSCAAASVGVEPHHKIIIIPELYYVALGKKIGYQLRCPGVAQIASLQI